MDEKRSKELTDEALDAVSGGMSTDEMREKLNSMMDSASGIPRPETPGGFTIPETSLPSQTPGAETGAADNTALGQQMLEFTNQFKL